MIFDKKKGKGVRRKSLPEPNPVTIDFEKDGTLGNVCEKAFQLFFKEFKTISPKDVKIADSSGNLRNCDYSQKVSQFYACNGYLPSRYKLYTVIDFSAKVYYGFDLWFSYLIFTSTLGSSSCS